MTPAAIYVRISSDPTGREAGVERQETECRELAAVQGFEVVSVFRDNDVSAYSGKPRPAWNQLREAIEAGDISVVIAWHTDRLYRRLRDLVPFMELAQRQNLQVVTVRSGDLDLSTASGRMMASILGAVAEAESAQKSERLAAQRRQAAERGQWNGGSRVYGYTRGMKAIVPEEAAVVREMADRLLAGDSLRALATDLNARGIPTALGKAWRPTTIRQMIPAARLSAQREHTPGGNGEKRRRGSGFGEIVADGTWPAILTKDDTARLRALLLDPQRRVQRAGGRLLIGIIRCGVCGQKMYSRTDGTRSDRWRYSCMKQPGHPQCGGVVVAGQPTDALVSALVLDLLESAARPEEAPPTELPVDWQAAGAVQERLDQLARDYAEGLIQRSEWLAARKVLEDRLTSLKASSANQAVRALRGLPAGAEIRELWPTLHLDRQRAIVGAVIERVAIAKAQVRGRRTLDPNRIEVIWRA